MRFPGIIPAVTTPFDATGGGRHRRARGQRRRAARRRRPRLRRHRHDGRGRAALERRERRIVVEAVVAAADGARAGDRRRVRGHAGRGDRLAADAAAAGASAIMCCRRSATAPTRARSTPSTARSAEAAGLPMMPYNNPEASGIDLRAELIARLSDRGRRGRRRQGVLGRRAADRGADHAAPDLEMLVGGDDWALEGFSAGATGWVTRRRRHRVRASASSSTTPAAAGELEPARAIYARLLPLAPLRHDAEARPVLQGRAGRGRLRRRPVPRRRGCRSTPPSGDPAARSRAARGGRRVRAATRSRRSTPTRRGCRRASITGGVARSRARRCSSASCTSRPRWTTCGCC